MSSYVDFHKGDEVEVSKKSNDDDDRTNTVWHSAIVLSSPAKYKNQIFVEYKTLASDSRKSLRQYVDVSDVRPLPPTELHRCFLVGENVDAFFDNGWRQGTVSIIFENSRYLVKFDGIGGEQIEVEQCNLRLHREWDDGSWVPPLQERSKLDLQKKSADMEVKSRIKKLKIKFCKRTSEPKFSQGTIVEVSSDEEGFQGSWYPAKIIGSLCNDRFLVKYLTLTSDDLTSPLIEEAYVQYIRPNPPEIPIPKHFVQLDEVDAWYNDGWWVGVISTVLSGLKYIIRFHISEEELEFEHCKLRPHRDWLNEKWVIASKENSNELRVPREVNLIKKGSGKDSEAKFAKGTKIEVKSYVEGFEGSWFTAIIVGLITKDKFLVEYLTLRTDDETEPLKEEADASCIRPCPPDIQRMDRFSLFDRVDAWYNDGWWAGYVCKVLCNLKYGVYFQTTNEELEFKHSNLRPHQEWIDGKWVLASRGS